MAIRPRPSRLLEAHRRVIDRFAPDADLKFFESAAFPWTRPLERSWRTIRDDLDRALAVRGEVPGFASVSSRQRRIADERWRTLVFRFFGRRVDENCRRFPATAALLDRIPRLTTAMFSILEEGGHIPAHHGPYKGVLRYHLGLRVPAGARLRVGDEIRPWAEGEGFFFDDTFEHEAWNPGPGDRVVLFLDVLRPLPPVLDVFNRACFQIGKHAADVREAQRNATRFAVARDGVRGRAP